MERPFSNIVWRIQISCRVVCDEATLSALLQRYSASGQWKERLASAMAARASVEYLAGDDAAADAVAAMLLGLTADEHMRVRCARAHARVVRLRCEE